MGSPTRKILQFSSIQIIVKIDLKSVNIENVQGVP